MRFFWTLVQQRCSIENSAFALNQSNTCNKCNNQYTNKLNFVCSVCGYLKDPVILDDVNYFELFGIKQTFDIDLKELDQKFYQLQRKLHPDNFESFDDDELVRISNIYSSYVNDAYLILKSDFERARYILKEDIPEDKSIQDFELLSKVMEIREQVEYASSINDLKYIKNSAEKERKEMVQKISYMIANHQLEDAKEMLIKLKYHNRILEAVDEKEHQFF